MKLVKKEAIFEPFEITLKIESEEEARTLYHVLNHTRIDGVIRGEDTFYPMNGYSDDLGNLCCEEARVFIKTKVRVYREEEID